MSRPRWVFVVAALLAVHFTLAVTSARHKGPTFDEPLHFAAGYTYWKTGDFRMAASSPPLAALWAALPLTAYPVTFPSFSSTGWHNSNHYLFGPQLFYGSGNPLAEVMARGRAMIAVVSVGLGLVVFLCSRKLFGVVGGLLSLLLYTFSPTMLAHARLVTADMTAAAFFLFAACSAWWVFHRVTRVSLICSTCALVGLFLSKMSAFFFLPMLLGMVLVRMLSREPVHVIWPPPTRTVHNRAAKAGTLLVIMLGQLLFLYVSIWAAYGFRYSTFTYQVTGNEHLLTPHHSPDEGLDPWEVQYQGLPRVKRVVEWARRCKVLPEVYLYTVALGAQSASIRSSFLDGKYSLTGFHDFFPRAFLYKTPLPLLALLAVALIASIWAWRLEARATPAGPGVARLALRGLYRTTPLWLLFAVYWAVSLQSTLNIGHRHILPTYPPLFIFAGAAATLLMSERRAIRLVVPVLSALFVVVTLRIYPHYLAYFNAIAGGPDNGYRHLVDSSLDWGQDLPGLKSWLDRESPEEDVYLAYFGNAPPRYFGINAYALPYEQMSMSAERQVALSRLTPGLYCISATALQQVYPPGLRAWTPELDAEYFELLPQMRAFEDVPLDEQETLIERVSARGDEFVQTFMRFQRLRFAKLCAYLRARTPDANVGHSILIYRVAGKELSEALERRS